MLLIHYLLLLVTLFSAFSPHSIRSGCTFIMVSAFCCVFLGPAAWPWACSGLWERITVLAGWCARQQIWGEIINWMDG